jgi:hypothetical protein
VNRRSYDLSRGASLIVRDVWYEGSAEAGFARVGDSSALTMDGSRVSSPRAFNPPAFVVDANAGRVALLLTHFDDRVQVEGNTGRASVLALAGMREENTIPVFTNAPAAPARALLVNLRQRVSPSGLIPRGTVPVADIGTMDGEFVRAMLRDTRSVKPPSLDPVPAGSSDLRLFRVWAANGANNIVLRATRPN